MKNKTSLTKDAILKDPYNYTLKEMKDCLGEEMATDFFESLYKNKPKNQTVKIKEVFNGKDTLKYAFELSDGYCIETVCIKRKTGITVLWLDVQWVVFSVLLERMVLYEIYQVQKLYNR